jgi:quinoprotein glucose dehydrogenase
MKTSATYLGAAFIGLAALGLAAASHAQAPSRSVLDGVYSEAQAGRGKALYEGRCAMCHGMGLEGADSAPPLSGDRFTSNWKGQPVAALTTRTRTTMPLDNPGSLGAAQVADITAYLFKSNQFPAGAAELPTDAQAQQQIRIDSK